MANADTRIVSPPAVGCRRRRFRSGRFGGRHTGRRSVADPCSAPVNIIACENSKTGTDPSERDLPNGAGDEEIQGFATDISVNVGQTIGFKIDTDGARIHNRYLPARVLWR